MTATGSIAAAADNDLARDIEALGARLTAVRLRIGRVIFGQAEVIDQALITLLAGVHALLIGVPGLAKTRLVETLGTVLALDDKRVQCTPDLMPADITGTEVIQEDKATGSRGFKFLKGPIFANVVLADEINRTPPKTQAALLEAMQEHQVTVGGERHKLSEPFFVLATQNPIEQEGTYPLPEAQLDRFMFNIFVDYPDEEEEFAIVRQTTADSVPLVEPTLSHAEVITLQSFVRKVPVADHVIRYAMQFARLTRGGSGSVPDFVRNYVSWGAGPRASQFLILGAKARAVLHGRPYVSTDDVKAIARPVLRHRIITNFNAEAEGIKSDDIVKRLSEVIPHDSGWSSSEGKMPDIFKAAEVH